MKRHKLLTIVGPTAVGKTALSLPLAKQLDGEIISGDSMQVYRGMDIGTAKALPSEQKAVPHHLIDIVDPDYPFSVADFQERARQAIDDIANRGKLPMLVGGTGLYVQSVTHGYRFSEADADESVRTKWRQYAEAQGKTALHEALRRADPESAARLHPNDVRRIIRALEIVERTGKTMTDYHREQQQQSPYDVIWIGLTMERETLYERINQRVDMMLQEGIVDEVLTLKQKGYTLNLVSMQGLGYKEIMMYLEGKWSLEEAVEMIKQNTRRFAKRQLSWFRRIEAIQWWDMTDETERDKKIADIYYDIAGKLVNYRE